jgi:hypothetical protein
MTTASEPYVFILDLDGTIIGDCSYQVILYNLEELCKKHKIKTKADSLLLDCYRPNSKLMRPFFKYFIGYIKKHYPNSLFYVYTASEKTWAYKEVSMIEKTHGFKFNRPVFTRDDCIADSFGGYRKSVKKILPKIAKSNKKYTINSEKILVVDNNDTFIDYKSNFLLCPTYNYTLFCDVWDKMKREYLKIMEIYSVIKNLIATNKVCKYCNYGSTNASNPSGALIDSKQLENKHKWLYKKHKKINSMNKKYVGDVFWKNLANAMIEKNIQTFDKASMEYLQKAASRDSK